MTKQSIFITLSVCLTVIIASALVARGGSLNPPVGAISPSGPTLAEVYLCAEEILARTPPHGQAPQGAEYFSVVDEINVTSTESDQVFELLESSGVLHSIWVKSGSGVGQLALLEERDGRPVTRINSGNMVGFHLPSPYLHRFDIRYRNGLRLRWRNTSSVTLNEVLVIYTPDRHDPPDQTTAH